MTPSNAELAAVLVQSVLYGVYLLMFAGSIYAFLYAREGRKNSVLLVVNSGLLVLITAHWILQIVRLFEAFVRGGRLNTPDAYYANLNNSMFVAKNALYYTQTMIGDLMMVYRLFVVWDRNRWVTLLPLACISVYLAGGIFETHQLTKSPSANTYDSTAISAWTVVMIFATLLVTFYVTALISWRVYKLRRVLKEFEFRPLNDMGPVIQILIEAATLYTSCAIFYIVAFLARSPIQYIALNMISPMIGIAFTLITVRATYRHREQEYSLPDLINTHRTPRGQAFMPNAEMGQANRRSTIMRDHRLPRLSV